MPSRRAVLAGLGGAAALYGATNAIRLGGLHAEAIPPDTWPLARHDHHNSARIDVTIPRRPSSDWAAGPVGSDFPDGLIVGPDRVYAGGEHLLAIDRSDGTVDWQREGASGTLAMADDRLFVAPSPFGSEKPSTFRVLDGSGEMQWQIEQPHADTILPTREAIFVGAHDSIRSLAPNGHIRFETGVPGAGHVYLMLYANRLYAGGPMGVSRYRRRTVYDAFDDLAPGSSWIGGKIGFAGPPALVNGRILVGYDDAGPDGSVRALDPTDGSTQWSALPNPAENGVDRQSATTPVVVNGTAFTAVDRWLDAGRAHELVGLDVGTGAIRWRQSLSSWTGTIVATTGSILVGTIRDEDTDPPDGASSAPPGSVRAIEPDGTERWRVEFDVGVGELAPVDGTIFTLLEDGRVVALR